MIALHKRVISQRALIREQLLNEMSLMCCNFDRFILLRLSVLELTTLLYDFLGEGTLLIAIWSVRVL